MGPVTPRELRIAPVMTGGTSLAVWMGGVTTELYALYRSPFEGSDTGDTYAALLALSATTPVIDVITGTSAGGLNGTLLAAAVHLGIPLDEFQSLRDVWMDAADLDQLLRDPAERHPPSLLRGDDHLAPTLRAVLQRWWDASTSNDGDTVDLLTTYTRIRPTPVARLDDFDEALHEVEHAGTLRFRADDLAGIGDGGRRIIDKLVLASRASSSIPGVFEPVLLPSGAPAGDLPDMSPHQPADVRGRTRWVVDGGLVVNLPLRYVLDRIFTRPASGRVRRVVAYISPTPTPTGPSDGQASDRGADAESGDRADGQTDDLADRPPTIAAALATTIRAPRAEGIAADVDALRRAGADVARQRSLRALAAPMVAGLDAAAVAELHERYCEQRAERSVDRLMARLLRRAADRLPDDPRASGQPSIDEQALRAELFIHRAAQLPVTVDDLGGAGRVWAWGISPVESAGSTVLGLLNRALDLEARLARDGLQAPGDPAGDHPAGDDQRSGVLGAAKSVVHDALRRVEMVRELDERYWSDTIDELLAAPPPERDLAVQRAHAEWPGGPDAVGELLHAHRSIAAALVAAADAIGELVITSLDRAGRIAQGRPAPEIEAQARLARELRDELRALISATGIDPERATQQRLLVLHVVATMLLGDMSPREQGAELCQISWNAPNLLDPDRPVGDTLAGPELARLGAFVKPSWRANDWFWGRLHGSARLVRLLIEPRRWWELGLTSDAVVARLGLDADEIGDELAFLDAPPNEVDIPASLPMVTAALTRRAQLAVARDELARVAAAVERSNRMGAREHDRRRGARAGSFRAAIEAATRDGTPVSDLSDDQITALVRLQRIGAETAADEMSSRLMTRTTVRTAAVARRAFTGRRSGLPGARLLRGITAPVLVAGAWLHHSRSALRRLTQR